MPTESRRPMSEMAREHYTPFRWVHAATVFLALWLITSPFIYGYQSRAMIWSDVLSGVVVLVLAVLALGRTRGWASWSMAAVGVWLLFAPLLFWAPTPAAYANDTLAGTLLIAFSFLIPMGMTMKGPTIPPGWSYNPSTWPQRAPMIGLAVVSFFAARYMAAYQLGYIDAAWDPFFGGQTERVLDSDVSRWWPVSDAGLGAMVYLIEALSGLMGDERRWRTMPWMVAMFGVAVVPLGIASIVLVIMQPLVVGAWCTLCLFTAALMLLMIPLALDEVVAMIRFVVDRRRAGESAWRVFWLGGDLPEEEVAVAEPHHPDTWEPRGMLWGMTPTLPLTLSAALGVWLMFAPTVFGSTGAAADADRLVGALVIVVATIAMAEVARPARFANVALGVALLVAAWFLDGATGWARENSLLAAALVVLLALPRGRIRDRYGDYDRVVDWRPRRATRRHPGRRRRAHA